jgi:hypothetical protein
VPSKIRPSEWQKKGHSVPEQTYVRVEWEKSPDSELWIGLVAALGAAAVAPAN